MLKSIESTSRAVRVRALGGGVARPPRAGDAPLAAAAFLAAAIDFLALKALLSACSRISWAGGCCLPGVPPTLVG